MINLVLLERAFRRINPKRQLPCSMVMKPAQPSIGPWDLSAPIPLHSNVTLHVRITRLETSTMVFVTTSDPSNSSSLSALGSYVYSMPNVCTACYVHSNANGHTAFKALRTFKYSALLFARKHRLYNKTGQDISREISAAFLRGGQHHLSSLYCGRGDGRSKDCC